MSSDTPIVGYQIHGEVGVIEINNPPVNALSQAVREGILTALQFLVAAPECEKILLFCRGRTFSAGADIKEFDKPPLSPHLPDVILAIANCPKPTVAAMHGTVLGGGFELALACDYRTATRQCKVGLPEVNLGLIPGAGGTQLLRRYLPMKQVVAMITSGKHYPVSDFIGTQLVSCLFEPTPEDNNKLLSDNINYITHHIDISNKNVFSGDDISDVLWKQMKAELMHKARGKLAPLKALEVLEVTQGLSLEKGMAAEREAFTELKASDQSQALRYAFRSEKLAVKYPSHAQPKHIRRLGVVGGGTMGVGIATTLINAGYDVTLIEQNSENAQTALVGVENNLGSAVKRGLISDSQSRSLLENMSTSDSLESLADVDLVIEAIFEDITLKTKLFTDLQEICRKDCIFATNTSYLDINSMAAALKDHGRMVGIHFFSPAHIMKLVEVVKTDYSTDTTIAASFEVARRCKKLPVLVGHCFGFAGNRTYSRYGREIQQLLLEGCTVNEVDSAMLDFGMAMGPLAVQDLAGIDVGHRARSAQPFPVDDPGYFKASALMVEYGHFGRKTGRGFYRYDEGKMQMDPEVDRLIADHARELGIEARKSSREEIQERALFALISEGYQLLDDGIITRLSDLDVIWLNGYGFPRHKGGPMFMANQMGIEQLESKFQSLRNVFGESIWPQINYQ